MRVTGGLEIVNVTNCYAFRNCQKLQTGEQKLRKTVRKVHSHSSQKVRRMQEIY